MKRRSLRTVILLLPAIGALLALRIIHSSSPPALRRDVALRNAALDFTGASTPPITSARDRAIYETAVRSGSRRLQNFCIPVSSDVAMNWVGK